MHIDAGKTVERVHSSHSHSHLQCSLYVFVSGLNVFNVFVEWSNFICFSSNRRNWMDGTFHSEFNSIEDQIRTIVTRNFEISIEIQIIWLKQTVKNVSK